MVGTRERLTNLAHATHEQTKTVEQYMEKNKEWPVSDDWKLARGTIGEARQNLTRLQHNLTPDYYPEGELAHFLDLLWPRYEYDQIFTRMDCHIDKMSEQVIDDCVNRELIKDINTDNRCHLKKFAKELQHFYQGRKKKFPCVRAWLLQDILLEGWLQDINNLPDKTPREREG